MSHQKPGWAFTVICSAIGILAGLFCAVLILAPLSRLIDSDDEGVVLFYFP